MRTVQTSQRQQQYKASVVLTRLLNHGLPAVSSWTIANYWGCRVDGQLDCHGLRHSGRDAALAQWARFLGADPQDRDRSHGGRFVEAVYRGVTVHIWYPPMSPGRPVESEAAAQAEGATPC